jgi:hypothetical protein
MGETGSGDAGTPTAGKGVAAVAATGFRELSDAQPANTPIANAARPTLA